MKLKEYSVDRDFINKLIEISDNNNIHVDFFEGSLVDNYVFYDTEIIKIKGIRRAKHIIIKEKYLNTWSSENVLMVTDDIKKVKQFTSLFEDKNFICKHENIEEIEKYDCAICHDCGGTFG